MRVGGFESNVSGQARQQAPELGNTMAKTDTKIPEASAKPKYNSNGRVSESKIVEAIEKANEKVVNEGTELKFSIHKKTNEIMIKVINTDTDEVIREIPSEKILDMVANFMEMAGILVDEEA